MDYKKHLKRILFWSALLLLVVLGIVGLVKIATNTNILLILLAFLGTIAMVAILLFKFAAKTAGKKKEAPEKPVQTTTAKKGTSLLGWLFTLLTLAAVGWFGWKYLNRSIAATPAPPALPEYPACAGSKNLFFDPYKGITKITEAMHLNCWSGWITTPADWERYYVQTFDNDYGLEVWFRDGSRIFVPAGDTPWFPNRRGIFRLRGKGGVVISIEKQTEGAGEMRHRKAGADDAGSPAKSGPQN